MLNCEVFELPSEVRDWKAPFRHQRALPRHEVCDEWREDLR
jgi:hypothetical protein